VDGELGREVSGKESAVHHVDGELGREVSGKE
jgi:hypothetical protein